MNELIENTLNIISKISSSRQGYLLQIGEQEYKILNICGGKSEDFNSLNDLLFQLLKAGGIDTEKVASLPTVRKILKEKLTRERPLLHSPLVVCFKLLVVRHSIVRHASSEVRTFNAMTIRMGIGDAI